MSRVPATDRGHTNDRDGVDAPFDCSARNPEIQTWQQAADQSIQYWSERHPDPRIEDRSDVVDLLGHQASPAGSNRGTPTSALDESW